MALLSLLFGRKTAGSIGAIDLDVTISDRHQYQSQVTQFPIENGSDISDHIINEPDRLTLEGFITDSPVNLLGAAYDLIKGGIGGRSRSLSAFDELVDMQKGKLNPITGERTRELLTVVTGLKIYTDMVMVSLIIPRDRRTGKALRFTTELQKITKTESELTKVPNLKENVENKGQPTSSIGKQTPKAAGESTKNQASIAFEIAEAITGR